MANPFEMPDAAYAVLCNPQNQFSLWPAMIAVPHGWSLVHGPATRKECLAFVSEHWEDICADVTADDPADCIGASR